MKFVFYFFIIAQFLNFLGVFAEKVKEDSSEFNPIKWEKVPENEEKPLKKIIWKSYKDDKSYFEKTNLKNKSKKNLNFSRGAFNLAQSHTLRFSFEEIDMPDAGEKMGLYSIGCLRSNKPLVLRRYYSLRCCDRTTWWLLYWWLYLGFGTSVI